jgi:hypothetical protein
MIEIWMSNAFVSDSKCTWSIVNVQSPKNFTRNDINVGLIFSVGDNIPRFTISIEQDN